eukprot:CAMPEP_0179055370 /NCGR_PEP_ID=MMETSP0796-20121207/23264_1 /TAXON_ID=73915 /ORGANISM="Pyrodinium bahamense, Strain pbaha01" /LENGTH=258 /DNA_ID=CAMNT_0020752017 /DNA_START=31 /DNA_END=807 /DNA_ORIENTATION=+
MSRVRLTEEEVLSLELLLIAEYKKVRFQVGLHEEWRKALRQADRRRVVQSACLEVQLPIMSRFGFHESEDGVRQCTFAIAQTPHTPEMDHNHDVIAWLLNPSMQAERPSMVPDAQVPKPGQENLRVNDLTARGSRWVVVGGLSTRGIIVRKGEELESPAFQFRLQHGAQLRAMQEVVGNRLHYRRLSGDGPDFGWVTVESRGRALVEPDLEGTSSDLRHGLGPHLCNASHQRFAGSGAPAAAPAWSASLRGVRAACDD